MIAEINTKLQINYSGVQHPVDTSSFESYFCEQWLVELDVQNALTFHSWPNL